MQVQCPKCGKIHTGSSDNAGSYILCVCGDMVTIPPYAKMKEKSFKAKLSGINYYRPALDLFRNREEKEIVLEFDSEDTFDRNAIRVSDKNNYALLGYVERHTADEVGHIEGKVVGLTGTLQLKSKDNIIVDFVCYYVPAESQTLKGEEQENFIISCPMCNDKYEVDSSILGKMVECTVCGAKWQIAQWGTNPSPIERIEDFNDVLSNAEVQYQPTSAAIMSFPSLLELNKENRFFSKNVLFTGFCQEEKESLAPIINTFQIKQPSCVCKKLDFLICGTNAGPSKIKKAQEMNIPMISAAQFIDEITLPEDKDEPHINLFGTKYEI